MRIIADRLADGVDLAPRPVEPALLEQARVALGLSEADLARAARPLKKGGKTGDG